MTLITSQRRIIYTPALAVPPASTIVFSNSISGSDGGIATDISIRIAVAVGSIASGPLNQVRVTLKTSNTASPGIGGIRCDHVSIGVSTGTPPNIVSFSELTFNGTPGCNIENPSEQQTSDWANLSFLSTDTLIVICDQGSVDIWGAAAIGTPTIGALGQVWYKTATDSYNVLAPAGFTFLGTTTEAILLIETR